LLLTTQKNRGQRDQTETKFSGGLLTSVGFWWFLVSFALHMLQLNLDSARGLDLCLSLVMKVA